MLGKRSNKNFTKQTASDRFAHAIAKSSLAISTFKGSISSNCCSLAFVSMVASYSCLLIPTRHHTSLTSRSVLKPGLATYAVTNEGYRMVSSKYFWRAVLLETFTSSSRPSYFSPDDITVPNAFLLMFEPIINSFRFSCMFCLSCHAIKYPLAEFPAFNIST